MIYKKKLVIQEDYDKVNQKMNLNKTIKDY